MTTIMWNSLKDLGNFLKYWFLVHLETLKFVWNLVDS